MESTTKSFIQVVEASIDASVKVVEAAMKSASMAVVETFGRSSAEVPGAFLEQWVEASTEVR